MISETLSHISRTADERHDIDRKSIEPGLRNVKEPLVLRGAVADWPAVIEAKKSDLSVRDYILQFDSNIDFTAFSGPSETQGRIFYNDDFSGLNCETRRGKLHEIFDAIAKSEDDENPPLNYIGSTPVATHLAGFEKANSIFFGHQNTSANIWIGGQSRISAHYDFSENVACVVAGKRRFILFPPEQLPNLYLGPIDFTPAGQPISLVDFSNPDFAEFPRFRDALKEARTAELEPGDALYIPGMWWHHVEALAPLNILVNYWYRRSPDFLGAPNDVLQHAIMTLRDLPPAQRKVWREMFQHYVFSAGDDVADHIPENIRGALAPVSRENAKRIRAQLLNRLNS